MQLLSYSAYGLHITRLLADSKGPLTKVKLSERLGISAGFTLSIMRRLVNAGLVKSDLGAYGGYSLARPARQITQREVIEACIRREVFGKEEGEPALVRVARDRMREKILPVLEVSLMDWPLPPEPESE
jgi:Rrf2 family protein